MNKLVAFVKDYWNQRRPNEKRGLVIAGIAVLTILFGTVGYLNKTPVQEATMPEKDKSLGLNPNLLEKSSFADMKLEQSKREEEMIALRKQVQELKELQGKFDELNKAPQGLERLLAPPPRASFPSAPPPPPPQVSQPRPSGPSGSEGPSFVGTIEMVSNPGRMINGKSETKDDAEKKKDQTVYLPPSFMEANMLSGLDAKTVESARNDPQPVLMRVKDIAVLPNEIKSNLKGCFVIAHGFGSLDDERVNLRLISLSCIANSGQSVIDQAIKGFVVDSDGKIGLRGTVVAKMGAMLSRSFLAGFFGGAGDALKAVSTTNAVSPLGVTQSIASSKDFAKAAVGGGISKSSDELQKFYLELARQTMPIIEVGATKGVTLVISEGVELIIKDYCVGGGQTCKKT
ncbi:MAG: TraB/VirB10 family protein [Deltaproteobacteria bacterium]|nr:TraB/VirB10 family protein [Deltaproteobacteria bacterium]